MSSSCGPVAAPGEHGQYQLPDGEQCLQFTQIASEGGRSRRRSSGTRSISGRTLWSGIAAMTRRAFGGVSGFVTSCLCWSCAAPRMGVASVGSGGCWSAPSPGSVSFGACGCGMQASRHPPGLPLARVRAHLLAVAAQNVEGRVKQVPATGRAL